MSDLASRHCSPAHGPALSTDSAQALLGQLAGWTMSTGAKEIRKTFPFENYYQAIAFVKAVAWIAHREDHHPDMTAGYNKVTIVYATHSVSGLSENDFICAARVDALLSR